MDTNYFEDELWKCETIENEARAVLHHIHVSINQTRAARINFDSLSIDYDVKDGEWRKLDYGKQR